MTNLKHKLERVALDKEAILRLESWINQINEQLGGMVKLSKSDFVNSTLKAKAVDLTENEVRSLARDHFDEKRFLSWVMAQMRKGKGEGTEVSIEELLRKREELLAVPDRPSKKGNGKLRF